MGVKAEADQKIVIRSRGLCNNYLEGLFHTVPSSLVHHCKQNCKPIQGHIPT